LAGEGKIAEGTSSRRALGIKEFLRILANKRTPEMANSHAWISFGEEKMTSEKEILNGLG
jgi:hypothetical protein